MTRVTMVVGLTAWLSTSTAAFADTEPAIHSKDHTDERITAPIDLTLQRPVVDLFVNGKGPYKFILDLGSSGNLIDQSVARSLELTKVGTDSIGSPGSKELLAVSRVEAGNVVLAESLTLENVPMSVFDLRKLLPVDGVLSPRVFSSYLITLDYPNSRLILDPSKFGTGAKNLIKYSSESKIIATNINIAGLDVEAHLDTGSPSGFALPFALKDKLRFEDDPVEEGGIRTPSGNFKKWSATLSGAIELAGIRYENPRVELIEGFPAVNIGYNVLKELKVTIDQERSVMRIERTYNLPATRESHDTESENEYAGWYGESARRVFLEAGQLYLQRSDGPKLKLSEIKRDLFKMTFDLPVRNELPTIRFERDENKIVIGLTFLFEDGREDFVKKDQP